MPSKTELALSTSEELKQAKERLIEEIQGLEAEKEKLKKKVVASGGDITSDIIKALQKIANQGNAQPIDMTPQGYKVLPPVPINSMLPIQKVKWRLENNQAFIDEGGEKPEIITERKRKEFVWQKKFVELYEAMSKEPDMLELLKLDTKLSKNPDPESNMVGFHLKEYYDANVAEINKRITERKKADAKYGIPVKRHVNK
jgi:hypothetical protein